MTLLCKRNDNKLYTLYLSMWKHETWCECFILPYWKKNIKLNEHSIWYFQNFNIYSILNTPRNGHLGGAPWFHWDFPTVAILQHCSLCPCLFFFCFYMNWCIYEIISKIIIIFSTLPLRWNLTCVSCIKVSFHLKLGTWTWECNLAATSPWPKLTSADLPSQSHCRPFSCF